MPLRGRAAWRARSPEWRARTSRAARRCRRENKRARTSRSASSRPVRLHDRPASLPASAPAWHPLSSRRDRLPTDARARACSQDDPPCGACLAAGCTLCGLADAHEEEVQAHNDACSRLHYALYGTDDEESSDDEAVGELESTLEPPEGEAAAAQAILLHWWNY